MYYFITDPDGYKIEVIRLTQFLENKKKSSDRIDLASFVLNFYYLSLG